MRARVYIDGFNLYYRALKNTNCKWLDLSALSRALLSDTDVINKIRYFTADVSPRSGDPDAPIRQQTYFRALRTIPEISFHRGRFIPKTIVRPLVGCENCFVEVHTTEEKGSDVNLATFLLKDAYEDKFDAALIISQDTDLLEPLRIVKQDLQKTVGVGWLEAKRPGRRHTKVSDFIRHANPSILSRCQFPNPVIGQGGRQIWKPGSW